MANGESIEVIWDGFNPKEADDEVFKNNIMHSMRIIGKQLGCRPECSELHDTVKTHKTVFKIIYGALTLIILPVIWLIVRAHVL